MIDGRVFKVGDVVRFVGETKSEVARICQQLGITCVVDGYHHGCHKLSIPGVPYAVFAQSSELIFVADAASFPADPGEE